MDLAWKNKACLPVFGMRLYRVILFLMWVCASEGCEHPVHVPEVV